MIGRHEQIARVTVTALCFAACAILPGAAAGRRYQVDRSTSAPVTRLASHSRDRKRSWLPRMPETAPPVRSGGARHIASWAAAGGTPCVWPAPCTWRTCSVAVGPGEIAFTAIPLSGGPRKAADYFAARERNLPAAIRAAGARPRQRNRSALARQKRTIPLISRNRGELPAPTNEPSRLVGGPTVAMLEPNSGFEMSFTG